LGFSQVRRVAQGCFIIFHARTRMENNQSTQRNPAHSMQSKPLGDQVFESCSVTERDASNDRM
jgi:hypothetical protein